MGQKILKLCTIVLNYIQHIFPGGEKNFSVVSPPLVRGLIKSRSG